MRVYKILYYTNDYQKFIGFNERYEKSISLAFNKGTQVVLLNPFNIKNEPIFSSLRQLDAFLDEYEGDLSDLTIVMDHKLLEKDTKKSLQTILIEYFEIKFIFDSDPKSVIFNMNDILVLIRNEQIDICKNSLEFLEKYVKNGIVKECFITLMSSGQQNEQHVVFLQKLFKKCKDNKDFVERARDIRKQLNRQIALDYVNFDFWKLPDDDNDFILNVVHTQDNLFDASNLRYCIKQWKYAELDVHSKNFSFVQNSRRDNLAICVEEEDTQNRFNSYCLFASGFRVHSVTTATELLRVNEKAQELNPSLIIRDYDLQFFDSSNVIYDPNDPNGSIKAIRGFRDDYNGCWVSHVQCSPCWSSFYNGYQEQTIQNNLVISDRQVTKASICHSGHVFCPIYFVSKGSWNVSINLPGSFIFEVSDCQGKRIVRSSHFFADNDGVNTLCIPGLLKPVSGIYEPFMCIPKIRNRLEAIKTPLSDYLDTTREGHAHDTSLDIHATVMSLIRRAEQYYNNGNFIYSAILSNEAIEYLNGFHEALLLKAYQILTISENAIAMDSLGGDEETLKKDTLFRINKIENEIDRILRRKNDGSNGNEDRRVFKYNVLNQIFSTCRKFCQDKEHFLAEDCFISAMAHVNEGFTPCDIKDEVLAICQKIHKSWVAKKNEIKFKDYE